MPSLAVWKFASCDGCQLTLLDLEDELLSLTRAIDIAHFPEATSSNTDGPYDVSLVEGSITMPRDVERIRRIRANSTTLIAIGACATAGGIQALRNFRHIDEFIGVVYPHPDYVESLSTSTPISEHVDVDYELQGCPISKHQLLEVLGSILAGRKPAIPGFSVCVECKMRGAACVMVASGRPCLGPITRAGCGAICPAYQRGCYGCFGPAESPNLASLARWWTALGVRRPDLERALHTFNAAAFAAVEDRDAQD